MSTWVLARVSALFQWTGGRYRSINKTFEIILQLQIQYGLNLNSIRMHGFVDDF